MKDIVYTDMNGSVHEAPEGTVPEVRFSVYAAVIHKSRVLLVRDAGSTRWALPGGRLEPGESYADCLVREGREETGHPIRLVGRVPIYAAEPVGFRFEPSDRWFWSVRFYCCGELDDPSTALAPDSSLEIEEARWVPTWELDTYPMSEADRRAIRTAQHAC